MTELDGDKLAKILGMLGSNHDGERAVAAALADKMVRELGLTWSHVIAGRLTPFAADIAFALDHAEALSKWDREFLHSIKRRRSLSPRQLEILDRLVAKAEAHARDAA